MPEGIPKREPIEVLCVKKGNSSKLVNGGIYKATSLITRYTNRYIYIDNIGSYDVNKFSHVDRSSLDSLPDFTSHKVRLNCEKNNYTGQIIICCYGNTKSLKEGELYYVEDQKSANTYYKKYQLKLRGIKRWLDPYHFYEVDIKEQRSMKFKVLNGEEIKTGEKTRKFLMYTKKEKTSILLLLISKIFDDINKIENNNSLNMNMIDMIVEKGKKYDIIKEDVEPFIDSTFKQIFENLLN